MYTVTAPDSKETSNATMLRVAQAPRKRILAPGRNCWRVALAHRAAVLVDAGDYFANLEAVLRQARRSIMIIGWDFDGRIRLRPDLDPEDSPPLGPLLRSLVEEKPELEVHILVWSIAVVHAPGAPGPLLLGADWQEHPRLHVKLDTQHPLYAAHHQKIVCIDDTIAFAGGIDLTIRRWDTPFHDIDNPHRIEPDGAPYDPVHDVQMIVDGEAARSVAEVARQRWKAATGEVLPSCGDIAEDLWPAALKPDFLETRVAIARTMPAWNGQRGVSEVAALTMDALEAAKRSIYLEAQYMTAPPVGDVLEAQLLKADGPEIVVVMTHESHGLAERLVMGSNRDRLIRRLKRADLNGRLRVYYPCFHKPDCTGQQILIHSKVIIVDDTFLRVGSSNLNNRSIGLDTECDLAIEAEDETAQQNIEALRNRLVAEHIHATVEELQAALVDTNGSLIGAIERLNKKIRGLKSFEAMEDPGPVDPVIGTGILDPKRPFRPFGFLQRKSQG